MLIKIFLCKMKHPMFSNLDFILYCKISIESLFSYKLEL